MTLDKTDGPQARSRLMSVLTLIALVVALGCFADRVFWWTHRQFADCEMQFGEAPQPAYCSVVSELDWMVWYGPLVSLGVSFGVLLFRRERWHSSPFTPIAVFCISALMSIRTVFVMLLGFVLRDLH
jgi:peptidoglycan biosynthesis protein MviN/MurJ (putative lipid II flippase)